MAAPGDNIYSLTWQVSDPLDYNQFLPIAQRMVDSFEIINTSSMTEFSELPYGYSNQTFDNMTSFDYSNRTFAAGQQTSSFPSGQPSGINWLAICRIPIVDSVISEPCETLTSPDGYALTAEGERVLRCLGGGAVVFLLPSEIQAWIRSLGPAVGCRLLSFSRNAFITCYRLWIISLPSLSRRSSSIFFTSFSNLCNSMKAGPFVYILNLLSLHFLSKDKAFILCH